MSKTKVNMNSCAVCTETYNKSNRKEVNCPSCNFSSCRLCYTTYWKNSISQGNVKLRCLSGHCEYAFDPVDMIEKKTFTLKDIKQLQSDIRAEQIKDDDRRELAMISDQDIARVKEALLCRRLVSVITDEISRRGEPVVYSRHGFLRHVSPGTKFLYHLRKTYNNISSYYRDPGDMSHMALFLEDHPEYIQQYMTPELYTKLVLGYNRQDYNDESSQVDEIKDIPVGNCSVDECRGFVKSKSFQCNVCSTKFCNKCMMTKQDDHVCDEKNIASFQLIKKECKPCPTCRASIYRIEGCADMFCVICKTAFSWRTGQIIRGTFHNPHHAEWLASMKEKHQLDPNVNLCNMHHLYMLDVFKYHGDVKKYINFVMHLRNSVRREYDVDSNDAILEYRVQYLTGMITKQSYDNHMLKLKKGIDYEKEIVQMIDSYVELMIGVINLLEHSRGRISVAVKDSAVERGLLVKDTPDDGYTYEMFFEHASQFTTEFYNTNAMLNKKYDTKRNNLFNEAINIKGIASLDRMCADHQFLVYSTIKKLLPSPSYDWSYPREQKYYVSMMNKLKETNELFIIPDDTLTDPERAYIQVLYLMEKHNINESDARLMRRKAKRNMRLEQLLDVNGVGSSQQ